MAGTAISRTTCVCVWQTNNKSVGSEGINFCGQGAQAAGRLRERPPAKLYPAKRQGRANFGGGPSIDQPIFESTRSSKGRNNSGIGSQLLDLRLFSFDDGSKKDNYVPRLGNQLRLNHLAIGGGKHDLTVFKVLS